MRESHEEALEAAKLAALVSGELGYIDKMSDSGSTQRANKINVQKFIAKAKNPNIKIGPERYLIDAPAGFALPPDESYVQSAVPDVYPVNRPTQTEYITPVQHVESPVQTNIFQSSSERNQVKVENNSSIFTRSDVDSIRNSLKNIDKTLAGLLNLMKNSKPTK
jgi:hypothetical protein